MYSSNKHSSMSEGRCTIMFSSKCLQMIYSGVNTIHFRQIWNIYKSPFILQQKIVKKNGKGSSEGKPELEVNVEGLKEGESKDCLIELGLRLILEAFVEFEFSCREEEFLLNMERVAFVA